MTPLQMRSILSTLALRATDPCRKWRVGLALAIGLLLPLLSGCLQSRDELEIQADGSGRVRLEIQTALPSEFLSVYSGGGDGETGAKPPFPPLNVKDAAYFFPSPDFTVTSHEVPTPDGRKITIEASFRDLRALLTSPYARAHGLSLELKDRRLVVRAVTGLEIAGRVADMDTSKAGYAAQVPGVGELKKKTSEMRAEFRLTLPSPVTFSPGPHSFGKADGNAVTWILPRKDFTNGVEFADELGSSLEVSCETTSFPSIPETPRHLGLLRFADLATGVTTGQSNTLNAATVEAAAHFVPEEVTVARVVDFSGEGNSYENAAQLTGTLELPKKFAPGRWGKLEIQEIKDASDQSLLLREDSGIGRYQMRSREEDGPGGEPTTENGDVIRKRLTIPFRPPEWSVQEISRIKASIALHYPGRARHLLKITNAIPKEWIQDASRGMGSVFDSDSREKKIQHPELTELGLAMEFEVGMLQPGLTFLTLQIKEKAGHLEELQVYDANGRPWPTQLRESEGNDARSFQVMLPGNPTPPFSLAAIVEGGGAVVTLPIVINSLPIGSASPSETPKRSR